MSKVFSTTDAGDVCEMLEKIRGKRSINPTYCSGGVGVSCCVLA